MSEWIKIIDRLPDLMEYVIGLIYHKEIGKYIKVLKLEKYSPVFCKDIDLPINELYYWKSDFGGIYRFDYVPLWMELPLIPSDMLVELSIDT